MPFPVSLPVLTSFLKGPDEMPVPQEALVNSSNPHLFFPLSLLLMYVPFLWRGKPIHLKFIGFVL